MHHGSRRITVLERKTQAAPEPAAPAPSTGFSFAVPPRKVSPPQPSIVVEEIPDEESPRKKSRGAAVNGVSKARTVTVEEVEDVEMQFVGKPTPSVVKPSQVIEIDGEGSLEKTGKEKSPSPTSSTSVNGFAGPAKLTAHGSFKSSAPRVSSKLRYSFAADKEEAEEKGEDNGKGKERALFADTTDTSGLDLLSAAAVPSAPRLAHAQLPASSSFGSFNRAPATGTSLLGTSATFGAPSASTFSAPTLAPSPFLSSTRKPAPKTTDEVKNVVRVMSVLELPTYNFDVPLSSPGAGPSTIKARQTAEAEPASALPTFDLTVPVPAKPVPVSVPSAVGFDWAAAGMKKPTVAGDQWKCSLCSCSNPASAVDCTVCNEPRPKAPAASTSSSGGFNWAAAGMKPPEKKADEWKCSDCMCSNPASATEKCTVCEAPRPGAIKATPPVSGFDWAAAGMKKPQNDNGWTCSVCMVNNKADAKKCIACESDR
ncbi:hypothetical protein NM688_g7003 [Phlebia brevispora]|uniref:Uncharacterized protein n=1 Tax=Phlebia brevispora TaxID=194682 RepID=A0ACC1SA92_9APHY|nr:hypothetical protein NM688_g7003 [Phlebia brevispora]